MTKVVGSKLTLVAVRITQQRRRHDASAVDENR